MKGKKTGGRSAGTPNKKTEQWEELGEAIITRHTDRFNSLLDTMEDKDFRDSFLQVLEYFKPKLSRATIAGDASEPITLNIFPVGSKRSDK